MNMKGQSNMSDETMNAILECLQQDLCNHPEAESELNAAIEATGIPKERQEELKSAIYGYVFRCERAAILYGMNWIDRMRAAAARIE